MLVKSVEFAPEIFMCCELCGNKCSRSDTSDICYDCKGSLMFIINNTKREYCRITLRSFSVCKFLDLLRNDSWELTDDIKECFGQYSGDYTCKYFD